MERLTKRDNVGTALLAPDYEELYTPEELIDRLLSRLSEYEDTGLTPEDCAAVNKADSAREYINLKRAEAEGRLVILPCKEGNTVYRISYRLNGFHEIEERPFSLTYFDVRNFGQTWFLTREEAEAKLKKEGE